MRIDLPNNTPPYLIQKLAKDLGLEVKHNSPEHKELVQFGNVRRLPRANTSPAIKNHPTFDGPSAA